MMHPSGYFNLMLIFISLSTFATIIVLFKTKTHNSELESLNVQRKLFNGHNKYNRPYFLKAKNDFRTKSLMIECNMFNKAKTGCLKQGNQIYLPLKYIQEKFDVIGF
jgi:hypothetical protein